jgi:spore maturation protein CgeB
VGSCAVCTPAGHRVTFFEPDAYGRQQHRDIDDPPWADVVVYAGAGEAGVGPALERARAPTSS